MVKTFLVTGGTGFIGQELVHHLLKQGHKVILWVRNRSKAENMFKERVECVTDLRQLASTTTVDVVVNLAGERILGRFWTNKQKARLVASRVGTTQALHAWMSGAQVKPSLLISGSAVGYFGVQDSSDSTELTEDSPAQGIFISELCQQWEQAAAECHHLGVEVVCLRFGMVLGHQGALPAMLLPVKLGLGGPMGGGRHMLPWVHVEDVLGIITWLYQREHRLGGFNVYNTVAPELVTQAEFVKIAARILKRPAFIPTPGFIIRTLLGEQATILLDGQRVIPKQLKNDGYSFIYPKLDLALKNLLIRPE